jgi:hypothetical protein
MSLEPRKFCELVDKFSYKGKSRRKNIPLTNVTFFLGAGFSKAWDSKYPNSRELFYFENLFNYKPCECIGEFVDQCGYDPLNPINLDIFSECYYKLEMLKKYREIRPRYIDSQTLEIIENEFKYIVWDSLNKKVQINYLKDERVLFGNLNNDQKEIVNFFHQLNDQSDGSRIVPEGLRTSFITTNYDFVLEGILDEYLSTYDDFHLIHCYRGITPIHVNGLGNIKPLHNHWLVHNYYKLNGGFEIFHKNNFFNIDYRESNNENMVRTPPEIILPSKEQNYTSIYFQSIFSKITRLLQETTFLIIVGYGFPAEDALLRFILRHFAEDDRDMVNKFLLYIDIGNKDSLKEKIHTITPPGTYRDLNTMIYNEGFLNFVKESNKIGFP